MEAKLTRSIFDEIAEERSYLEYASRWQRLFNYLIDVIAAFVLYFILMCILILTTPLADVSGTPAGIFAIALFAISIPTYYIISEGATKGHTLGKFITKTLVIRDDLSQITWKNALVRSLIRLVPFEPLSTFASRPWHDQWSKTIVIKKRKEI